MDILRMLSDLRAEREQIEEAILALERLARGQGKRRGRPPKWLSAVSPLGESSDGAVKKRVFSAETRRKMAAAQKRRWAARKKAAE
jgi:hypothetical protein